MTVEQLKAEHKRYLKAVIGQLGAKGSRLRECLGLHCSCD